MKTKFNFKIEEVKYRSTTMKGLDVNAECECDIDEIKVLKDTVMDLLKQFASESEKKREFDLNMSMNKIEIERFRQDIYK